MRFLDITLGSLSKPLDVIHCITIDDNRIIVQAIKHIVPKHTSPVMALHIFGLVLLNLDKLQKAPAKFHFKVRNFLIADLIFSFHYKLVNWQSCLIQDLSLEIMLCVMNCMKLVIL